MLGDQKFKTNAKEDVRTEVCIQALCHVFSVSAILPFFLTQLLTSRRKKREKKTKILVVYPAQK